jgi:hypothetical protein
MKILKLTLASAEWFARGLALLVLSMLALSMPQAAAQTVPVALNLPSTVSANITAGATALDVPFAVSGADSLSFDLIVPVNGAALSLVDPAGQVVPVPGDPRVSFHSGSTRTPPLPGGVFQSTILAAPANGTWILRLTFPAAPGPTVALGTILARSRYQAGIAIERNTLLVGEDVSVGMVVLDNGVPITGLNPTIAIGSGVPGAPQAAADNGHGADGLANDGVYSIDHTFGAAGLYNIVGNVQIPTPAGPVQRSAASQVRVVAPLLSPRAIRLETITGTASCVAALRVTVDVDVLKAGRYASLIRLAGAGGASIDVRSAKNMALGAGTMVASFSAADIKSRLSAGGPFAVTLIDALEVGSELVLAYRKRDAGAFNVAMNTLCAEAIELKPQLTVTPVVQNGYLVSLTGSFPVTVRSAGFYQISYKVIGANGEIALMNASRSLSAGLNNVSLNWASDAFQAVDGPYRAISLLVVGGGSSARLSEIGASSAYERWQFAPKKPGDLDNDGVVGPADVALVNQYRGMRALAPGDRRDINRDGLIDIRDSRAIQGLR